MIEGGYIRIYRSLLKWEWYDDINTKALFLHLLLTANYEDKKWHGIIIKRGQRKTSYLELAGELRLSERNVRTAVKHLESTGEVTHEKVLGSSIFTVLNYSKFQIVTDDLTLERQKDDRQPTDGRQMGDINGRKLKKAKKEKENILLSGAETTPDCIFIEMPLNDKSLYPIMGQQVLQWERIYPAVDVKQQLRSMLGWLNANPTKRKTKGGVLRFINSWLSKAQDKPKAVVEKAGGTPWL